MKLTLLEIVQDMLTAIDSENVTDVGDTEESGMCVNIANRAYEWMISKERWRHLRQYSTLNTTSYLNEMSVPSGTIAIDPYNVYYSGTQVEYIPPEDFVALTITRDTSESNITTSNTIKIYTDRNPNYFTSDDDETLRFDAIPDSVGGLVGSSFQCLIYKGPTSRLSSSADYFDLPYQGFPALDELCISLAIGELKGDSSEAQRRFNNYKRMMSALGRNARLIDIRNDRRKWIVPRQTSLRVLTPLRNTGNGYI